MNFIYERRNDQKSLNFINYYKVNNENTMEILSHNENWSEARECQERIQCLEKALGFMQAELDKLQGVDQESSPSKIKSKKRIQYDHITGTVFENYQKCRI